MPEWPAMNAPVFLDYLAGWAETWSMDPVSTTTLQFTMGPENWDRRSAWIATESPTRMGHLTLWDSGELEIEVVDATSMEAVHAVSAVISDTESLAQHLRAFLDVCETSPM